MSEQLDGYGFFLDATERELVQRGLAIVGEVNPGRHAILEGMLLRLRALAELIQGSPPLASSWGGDAGRSFSAQTLIDKLCRVHDYDIELHIPTKAVIGQAYVIARINFMKALGYTLDALNAPSALCDGVEREVAQSIYTKLAEELFVAIVTDASTPGRVKAGAARFLYRIWEERLQIEVDDFAPLLESAWDARSKLLPILGTMLGTHEVFRLFQEARDPRFLDYFGTGDVESEQLLAFEEFLFGLSHEEITKLRQHMADEGRACITLEQARALLSTSTTSWPADRNGAAALYTSYKKRRLNAAHRVLTGASGPKRTAEEYVMMAFLDRPAAPLEV